MAEAKSSFNPHHALSKAGMAEFYADRVQLLLDTIEIWAHERLDSDDKELLLSLLNAGHPQLSHQKQNLNALQDMLRAVVASEQKEQRM